MHSHSHEVWVVFCARKIVIGDVILLYSPLGKRFVKSIEAELLVVLLGCIYPLLNVEVPYNGSFLVEEFVKHF